MVVLLALTAIGLTLSRSPVDPTLCGPILLAIAAYKARLVVLDYFGLRDARGPWQAILTTWIIIIVVTSAASAIPFAITP